jgi:AcrR family transcriptional regulator
MEKLTAKEKILKAATTLFVAHGFDGTSIGKIAKLANVTHSLVFHHYPNKQALWLAVKLDIVDKSHEKKSLIPKTNQSIDGFLTDFVHDYYHFYQNNPDFIRMIQWQRLSGEQDIGIKENVSSKQWIDAICHYQKKKELNEKFKPEFVMTFMFSCISSIVLDNNEFIDNENKIDEYLLFCIKSLTTMLKASA